MTLPSKEMNDPFCLQRFVDAQDSEYAEVREELKRGYKSSHWMWFIFPQIKGLGGSFMSKQYAISSLEEAKAYLDHPILAPRLLECTRLVIAIQGHSIQEIFGYTDSMKFRSSMTLFSRATSANSLFTTALEKYFQGQPDPLTLERL